MTPELKFEIRELRRRAEQWAPIGNKELAQLRRDRADLLERYAELERELAVARGELEVVRHGHRKVCDRMNNTEAELAKLRQKLMRYEHAEAADILHPPQDEQARADFPEEK